MSSFPVGSAFASDNGNSHDSLPAAVVVSEAGVPMIPAPDKVSVHIEEQDSSMYVYPATGDTVRANVSRTVAYASYEDVTLEAVVFASPDQSGQEQEINAYFDRILKTSIGELKIDATVGEWWVDDGHVTNLYAEVSREFALGKSGKVTAAPLFAFGQWVGSGYEPSKAYALVGIRLKDSLGEKVALSFESAYSHCIREDARLTRDECHEVVYANTEIAYTLSETWTIYVRVQVNNSAPATVAIAIAKSF